MDPRLEIIIITISFSVYFNLFIYSYKASLSYAVEEIYYFSLTTNGYSSLYLI